MNSGTLRCLRQCPLPIIPPFRSTTITPTRRRLPRPPSNSRGFCGETSPWPSSKAFLFLPKTRKQVKVGVTNVMIPCSGYPEKLGFNSRTFISERNRNHLCLFILTGAVAGIFRVRRLRCFNAHSACNYKSQNHRAVKRVNAARLQPDFAFFFGITGFKFPPIARNEFVMHIGVAMREKPENSLKANSLLDGGVLTGSFFHHTAVLIVRAQCRGRLRPGAQPRRRQQSGGSARGRPARCAPGITAFSARVVPAAFQRRVPATPETSAMPCV